LNEWSLDSKGKLDWSFVPTKKANGVDKTKVGKGSKVVAVVDGNGLHVDSAQPNEITLAEPTLQMISVARKHGRPKTRPNELAAHKAYDSTDLRRKLRCGTNCFRPLSAASLRKEAKARTSSRRPSVLES
jgi:protein required for attachment to host cells